jgi:acetyltransferase-like isoleucine patch superfamily enzyme
MSERHQLADDWYHGGIPSNVVVAEDVYLDSSYAFAFFLSQREPGLILGRGCGVYDRASFVVGPEGFVEVGSFTCLNGVYVQCQQRITIGAHCLLAWGAVITDCTPDRATTVEVRRAALGGAAQHPQRWLGGYGPARPVKLEDNVWVGFDAVVRPGVTLGRGCIVGCKTVVTEDVPPSAVYVGQPGRIVRYLDDDDTPQRRQQAMREFVRA